MEDIRTKGEFCLLSGDMNKLVGVGEFGVEGNHQELSLVGRLLRDLLATKKLVSGEWHGARTCNWRTIHQKGPCFW